MQQIFLLLVIFQVKHFLADYPLQGKYMLGKFKPGWAFFMPLLAHCEVHACFTFVIAYVFTHDTSLSAGLGLTDLCLHFFMDRMKAGPKYLGRFKDMMKPYFWWCLGLDQMWHHLTHYYLIYRIIIK